MKIRNAQWHPLFIHTAHNNGMHPTAGTLPVIFLRGAAAAGDAGR
jgi:hypothetical protein